MQKLFSACCPIHRRTAQNPVKERCAVLRTRSPMPPQKPDDVVSVTQPRYAMAALETVYRQTHPDAPVKIPDADLWFFAKFPDVWATTAIRAKGSRWNFKRVEPIVVRVRALYVWASPILEN